MGSKTRDLRILVTGGQGFLGGALVQALVELGFSKVAATARRKAPELESLGVEIVSCDLSSQEQAAAATRERDVIFHTAAKAGVWGADSLYRAINVDATRFLIEGAQENGVQYFIHTSSPSVTFQGEPSRDETEAAAYGQHPLNAYCRTKIASEKLVLEANDRLQTLALRPHLIYGPGDPHLLPRVFEASQKGRLVRVGEGRNWVDVTHIKDAVASQLCALAKREEDIWGRAYFITSGVPIRLWSWLAHILKWKGLPSVRKSVGLGFARRMGSVLETVYHKAGKTEEPPLTEFSALQLGCDHTYSIEKAQNLLGYSPQVHPYSPFEEQFDAEGPDWSCYQDLFRS